jgi:ribosomal protein S18 acetylase RimI-like enzyme
MTVDPVIAPLDPTDPPVAERIVQIQRLAYAIEAELIGFDGIPPLHETPADVAGSTGLTWFGAFVDGLVAGLIAWEDDGERIDIDRLAVDPAFARRGLGRLLVRSVPTDRPSIVSTGAENDPAVRLYLGEGFAMVGQTEIDPGTFTTQFARAAVSSAQRQPER